jgi:uncharacterized phiE125 gp8 family phage protein
MAEAKLHLRVIDDAEDDYILNLIAAATVWAEKYTRRAFMTQTVEVFYHDFDDENAFIELPKPKFGTLTHIKYYDDAGVETDLDTLTYYLDSNATPATLSLRLGQTWPETESGRPSAVRVKYTCGYGKAADVPMPIKQGIMLLIGHWYENRENIVVIHKALQIAKVPQAAESLLGQYRVHGTW